MNSQKRLASNLLVHFKPRHRVLDGVLQAKEPRFSESQSSAYQVKQVLAFPLHLQEKEREAKL